MFKKSLPNGVIILCLGISSISLVLCLIVVLTQPKIVYVNNSKLIQDYKGTIEGNRLIEEKKHIWQANLDSLSFNYNHEVDLFKKERSNLSLSEIAHREAYLDKLKNEVIGYKNALELKIKEEENYLSSAIIKQINSYVLEYAENSDYDYVFGVTDNGSIHYGKQADDITDEVLNAINRKYAGE